MADTKSRGHALLAKRAVKGERPKAADINLIVDHVNRQNTGVDGPSQIANAADNPSIFQVQRFQITAILDDYLVCVTFNGASAGTNNINVARPYLLRASIASHNGVTFTKVSAIERTASDGSNPDETQVIVPAYAVGDQVWAFKSSGGGTGAVGAKGKPVIWMDMNLDARAWAKEAA